MSLKAFHLIFIIASILLCVGFGVWALMEYRSDEGTRTHAIYAGASLAAVIGLVVYEVYFLKKTRNVSYL